MEFDLALEGHVGENVLYLHSNRVLRREDLVGEQIAAWQVDEAFHEIALHFALSHHIKDMPDRSTFRRRETSDNDEMGALRPAVAAAAGILVPQYAKAVAVFNGVKAEALSHHGYNITADLTEIDELSFLLRAIGDQEEGHGQMFQSWGQESLPGKAIQWMVRRAASRPPVLVGEGFQPEIKTKRVLEILSKHPDFEQNILYGVDQRIDTLPGLGGMHVVEQHINQILG